MNRWLVDIALPAERQVQRKIVQANPFEPPNLRRKLNEADR